MGKTLIVGSRASALALTQSRFVIAQLSRCWPDLSFEIRHITTHGDRVLDRSLTEIGGKGVFVKEIEEALLSGAIDLAVHSAKDLPTQQPARLLIGAIMEREDPRDVLVGRDGGHAGRAALRRARRDSSRRRASQLSARRPDLETLDIRGNVDTRLRKLDEGQYDAIVLAAAGLKRLGLIERATEYFDPGEFLPAPAQGALAVEVRRVDEGTAQDSRRPRTCAYAGCAVEAERAFLRALGGGLRDADGRVCPARRRYLVAARRCWPATTARCTTVTTTGRQQQPKPWAPRWQRRSWSGSMGALDRQAMLPHEKGPPGWAAYPGDAARRPGRRAGRALARAGRRPPRLPNRADRPARRHGSSRRGNRSAGAVRLGHIHQRQRRPLLCRTTGRQLVTTRPPWRMLKLGRDRAGDGAGPGRVGAAGRSFVPAEYVAEAIVEGIGDVTGQRILLPRADIARKALAEGLRAKGALVDEVVAYHTVRGRPGGV